MGNPKRSKLENKDLTFIDEGLNELSGTVMVIENNGGPNKYFFVPYNGINPFRIPLNGKNRISFEEKNYSVIYGHSDNYLNTANNTELVALAEVEGILRTMDLEVLTGRGGPCLINAPSEPEPGKQVSLRGMGFSGLGIGTS